MAAEEPETNVAAVYTHIYVYISMYVRMYVFMYVLAASGSGWKLTMEGLPLAGWQIRNRGPEQLNCHWWIDRFSIPSRPRAQALWVLWGSVGFCEFCGFCGFCGLCGVLWVLCAVLCAVYRIVPSDPSIAACNEHELCGFFLLYLLPQIRCCVCFYQRVQSEVMKMSLSVCEN